MAKELDIIMTPNAVPAGLKTAIDNHKKSYDALKKAEAKMADAKKELATATTAFQNTDAMFRQQLELWSGK